MKFPGFGANVAISRHMVFVCSTQDTRLNELLSDDFIFEMLMRKLTPKEQLSVLNKKHSRCKALVLHLFQRIVLNYALFLNSDVSQFDPMNPLLLSFNEHGKPTLTHSNVQFNSSTSDDWICIVLQFGLKTPVGIDLSHEEQAAISGSDYVARFAPIFSDQELRQLREATAREKFLLFNQLWTLKEAFTKFLGCGLNTDLSRFWFSGDTFFSESDICPIGSQFSHFDETYFTDRLVSWRDVTVNLDGLADKWKNRIGAEPVRCSTAVLAKNVQSPVFISLVAQSDVQAAKLYELDMVKLLQYMVDQDS